MTEEWVGDWVTRKEKYIIRTRFGQKYTEILLL